MRIPIELAKTVGRKIDREGIWGEATPPRECLTEKVADALAKGREICEVNSLDELMAQVPGSILIGCFQDGFNDEEVFVVYNGTRDDRQSEFLEPGKKYYLNPDIDIHAWLFPADKLIFPGNGSVRLPVAYRKLKTYSPSDEGYSARRELVRRV